MTPKRSDYRKKRSIFKTIREAFQTQEPEADFERQPLRRSDHSENDSPSDESEPSRSRFLDEQELAEKAQRTHRLKAKLNVAIFIVLLLLLLVLFALFKL